MWEEIPSVSTTWEEQGDSGFDLLLEAGERLLQEDGSKLKLEQVFTWEEIPTVTTIWT